MNALIKITFKKKGPEHDPLRWNLDGNVLFSRPVESTKYYSLGLKMSFIGHILNFKTNLNLFATRSTSSPVKVASF